MFVYRVEQVQVPGPRVDLGVDLHQALRPAAIARRPARSSPTRPSPPPTSPHAGSPPRNPAVCAARATVPPLANAAMRPASWPSTSTPYARTRPDREVNYLRALLTHQRPNLLVSPCRPAPSRHAHGRNGPPTWRAGYRLVSRPARWLSMPTPSGVWISSSIVVPYVAVQHLRVRQHVRRRSPPCPGHGSGRGTPGHQAGTQRTCTGPSGGRAPRASRASPAPYPGSRARQEPCQQLLPVHLPGDLAADLVQDAARAARRGASCGLPVNGLNPPYLIVPTEASTLMLIRLFAGSFLIS